MNFVKIYSNSKPTLYVVMGIIFYYLSCKYCFNLCLNARIDDISFM